MKDRRGRVIKRFLHLLVVGHLAGGFAVSESPAQIPNPLRRAKEVLTNVPSLASLLESEPPLTTSLSDAVTEIPYLDGFEPSLFIPFTFATPDENGLVHLPPGAYQYVAQSYCLKPGGYQPGGSSGYFGDSEGEGEGYVYATFQGSKAQIIEAVLRRSANAPEIAQRDVQLLLWAIIARTDFGKMSSSMKRTAERLLTDDEIDELKDQAWGELPDEVMRQMRVELPPFAREIFEAEAELRGMFGRSNVPFEEFERVAVRAGVAPAGGDLRFIPRGRWSFNPDGYFVRYAPNGYTKTAVNIVVPGRVAIERDAEDRIVRIVDSDGRSIEVRYSATVGVAPVPGDPTVRASAIEGVRTGWGDHVREFLPSATGSSWVLVGTPSGTASPPEVEGFWGLPQRYEEAARLTSEWRGLASRMQRGSGASLHDMVDLAQIRTALEAIEGGSGFDWVLAKSPEEFVANAWQSAACRFLEGCEAMSWDPASTSYLERRVLITLVSREPPTRASDSDWRAIVRPTIAQPADEKKQRIGVQSVCTEGSEAGCKEAARTLSVEKFNHCIEDAGYENMMQVLSANDQKVLSACLNYWEVERQVRYCDCRCESVLTCKGPIEPEEWWKWLPNGQDIDTDWVEDEPVTDWYMKILDTFAGTGAREDGS